jgi:predicted methyltransferase
MYRTAFLLTALLLCAGAAHADVKTALESAMASELRTEADRARDANRKPLETLQFFGLRAEDHVLELVPGGGWYTKLLAPVLKDKGKLYVALGTQGIEESLLKTPGMKQVVVVPVTAETERQDRRVSFKTLAFDVSGIDLVLTFRNLHNFTAEGRDALNREAFRVLKPGGRYGVVDHTRRHMEGDGTEVWRRMDPVQMIKEIEAAGFEFVDYSTLHYRPDDELRYEVGRKTVTGNTDRFTLLFRKPE